MPLEIARLHNEEMVPLIGGAYQADSIIANAQRCVNLYPEVNQGDSPTPITHYQVPGLVALSPCPTPGRARGTYWATNGQLFAVVGVNVYAISTTWVWTQLGTIAAASTPVSMVDNGQSVILVDGSSSYYVITLGSNAFALGVDADFLGASRIEYLSTFLLSNVPGTQEFQSTLSGVLDWDPLYVASKTGFPDPLVSLLVMHLEIWLIGKLTTEVWYNAGNANFPFALFPGVFIEHGCAATYAVAKHDLAVFWLGQDKDGRAEVLKGSNYKVERVSTHAIEVKFQSYQNISDCITDLYQIKGHIFVRFHFPSANATWVYDDRTNLWHEIVYTDQDGNENCSLDRFATNAGPVNVSLGWQNGTLYQLDPTAYDDAGVARVYRRGFPHMVSNGKRVSYAGFKADLECGTDTADDQDGPEPQVFLRWSDNRGKSFGNPVGRSMGLTGEYLIQPQWRRLGLARDRVFEIFYSTNAKAALNGAWVDPMPMAS